jgi:hypothetical protein
MRDVYHLEHRPGTSTFASLSDEFHCLIEPPAYRAHEWFCLFGRCNSRSGNYRQQDRIGIVECHIACPGVPSDRLLIEKNHWILSEDASVLFF